MSSFDCIGSAIAWYKGDVPELLELQANFHVIRKRYTGNNQPYRFKRKEQLFEYLSGHYKEAKELRYQLLIAEKAFDAGMMNFRHLKRSGCLSDMDYLGMKVISINANQLADPCTYVPDWYWKALKQQENRIRDGIA